MKITKVLIVDDEPNMRFFLSEALTKEGYACNEAGDGLQALERIKEDLPDIVVLDLKMPRMGGMEALRNIRGVDPDMAVIIITAFGTRETAYEAMREGAYDYFSKPVDIHEVRVVVGRAAERVRLARTVRRIQEKAEDAYAAEAVLGRGHAVQRLRELMLKLSQSESTVLITGESGTGKELAAKVIHYQSKRKGGPLVAVNCAAIPEALLEAELFGHEKGAFTGAHQQRTGRFESAGGGTVFLDEIGDMPLAMQTKILRVLQDRTFERVGGVKTMHVDIRLIAATNRDLEDEMKTGRFRSDLYYRLNVIAIHLPPLRARMDDVPILADAFLRRMAEERKGEPKGLDDDVLSAIMAYDWPGNVRELENALERALTLTPGERIPAAALPARVTERRSTPLVSEREHANPTLEAIERAYIMWILQGEGGNKTRAAEVLGIDPSTLYRKLGRYEGGSAG